MRHIQNNYQYMTHVYEAGLTHFELSNLHMTADNGSKGNSQSMLTEQNAPRKSEPLLGNVYGTLKRNSNPAEPFVYEYFEGSTNKIKYPMKFSALLEMFR